MTFQKKLSTKQEGRLLEDYSDGWTVQELTIIYRVSTRTVYRTLAAYNVRLKNKRTRKRRKPPLPKALKKLKPCGTNAAYARHKRKGEYPCTPCLEAHARNVYTARLKSR